MPWRRACRIASTVALERRRRPGRASRRGRRRHPVGADERDRRAVGGQHGERRSPGAAVDRGVGRRRRRRSPGPSTAHDVGAVHLAQPGPRAGRRTAAAAVVDVVDRRIAVGPWPGSPCTSRPRASAGRRRRRGRYFRNDGTSKSSSPLEVEVVVAGEDVVARSLGRPSVARPGRARAPRLLVPAVEAGGDDGDPHLVAHARRR